MFLKRHHSWSHEMNLSTVTSKKPPNQSWMKQVTARLLIATWAIIFLVKSNKIWEMKTAPILSNLTDYSKTCQRKSSSNLKKLISWKPKTSTLSTSWTSLGRCLKKGICKFNTTKSEGKNIRAKLKKMRPAWIRIPVRSHQVSTVLSFLKPSNLSSLI